MLTETEKQIRIDLDQFKLHLNIEPKIQLSLHFDTTSRKFYLSVIALVVSEMKRNRDVSSILLETHQEVLALLNETIGGFAGSSKKRKLIPRIYKKWKSDLPDLEKAPLFRIIGKKKGYGSGIDKTYVCREGEKDCWANLFEYKGSGENVRLRFSIDALGITIDNCFVTYKNSIDDEAWEHFLSDLKKNREANAITKKTFENPEKVVEKTPGQKANGLRLAPVAIISLIVVAVGLVCWKYYFWQPQRIEPASLDQMAFPLPDKPSIAVLPFDNMSGDPTQDYIADGLTENIITGLSQIPEMFVIARNSVFTYKGKPIKIKQVSEDLGVRYVLEGSIQKAGDRLRVSAQLIDALKGNHLWSKRYDRDLKDLFKLQDDITINILDNLHIKLVTGEESKFAETDNFEAWNHFIKGSRYHIRLTKEDNRKAKAHLEQAVKLDPDFGLAWGELAFIYAADAMLGSDNSSAESINQVLEIVQKKSDLWPASFRHTIMNSIYNVQWQYEKAIAEGEKSVALDPNSPVGLMHLASSLNCIGRPEEAIVYAERAMRLDPYVPAVYLEWSTWFYDQAGRYKEGLAISEKLYERALEGEYPLVISHFHLTLANARLNRMKEARKHMAEYRMTYPNLNVSILRRFFQRILRDHKYVDSIVEMLRKAGLPE